MVSAMQDSYFTYIVRSANMRSYALLLTRAVAEKIVASRDESVKSIKCDESSSLLLH